MIDPANQLHAVLDVLSWILLVGGTLFALIGGIGIVRFPDLFTRMHAAGVTDTLGAGMILAGLALQSTGWQPAVKLVFIVFFLLMTSPTSTHALARAARNHGVYPLVPESGDEERPSST